MFLGIPPAGSNPEPPKETARVSEPPEKAPAKTSDNPAPGAADPAEEPVPVAPPKEGPPDDMPTAKTADSGSEDVVSPPKPPAEKVDIPVTSDEEPSPPSQPPEKTTPSPTPDKETPEALKERLLASFSLDEDRAPAERQKTARAILDAALAVSEKPDEYRVLLTAAAEEARDSGQVEIMTEAIDRLSKISGNNVRPMNTEMLAACAENIFQREQAEHFVSLAEDAVLETLLDDSRHEDAKKLDAATDALCRKSFAGSLRSRARTLHKMVDSIVGQEEPLLPKRRTLGEWRDPAYRAAMLKTYGGTAESERAVERALEWLASVQFPDGGWCFDHGLHPARNGKASDVGSMTDARSTATGIALLPFLAAGNTHREGRYKETVAAGLDFLSKRIEPEKHKKRLVGGTLRRNGEFGRVDPLCGLAFVEAFAMTGDKRLKPFIERLAGSSLYAQHPERGGWNYDHVRGEGGVHTTLAYVQFLFVAGLLDQETIQRTTRFLNTCRCDGGARYRGRPGETHRSWALDASGLYLRVLLGGDLDDPGFKKGIDRLITANEWRAADTENSVRLSELLFQADGEAWRNWHSVYRDRVLRGQEKEGIERGSWSYDGAWPCRAGGRVYSTATVTLTLQTGYRYPRLSEGTK